VIEAALIAPAKVVRARMGRIRKEEKDKVHLKIKP
jgi:hypothetical protein